MRFSRSVGPVGYTSNCCIALCSAATSQALFFAGLVFSRERVCATDAGPCETAEQ